MQPIVIVGSSGHAKVVIDIVEKAGVCRLVGLIDTFRRLGESTLGYQILGSEAELPDVVSKHGIQGVIIAVGDNFVRARLAQAIRAAMPDVEFPSAVHPAATIGRDVSIGEGTVLMAGAVANPCARVGAFCILNTNASLDHDATMDDYASLAPRAAIGGNVQIGSYAAVGLGAVVSHGVRIGEHAVIGAGAAVVEYVAPFSVAMGVPARVTRTRDAGEKYL